MRGINAIIFSKNRALQLDALLRSMRKNCDHFHRIFIQYHADENHLDSYTELEKRYRSLFNTLTIPSIKFIKETRFESTFKNLLKRISVYDNWTHKFKDASVALFVDDNIIFKEVPSIPVCDIFSLRLGPNIQNPIHFNYPGSVDGNVFKKDIIMKLLNRNFNNPNQLEVQLMGITRGIKMTYKEQYLIGIPHNKVSDSSTCSDMGGNEDELLKLFEDGYEIDCESMNLEHDNVHKNVGYIYRKR